MCLLYLFYLGDFVRGKYIYFSLHFVTLNWSWIFHGCDSTFQVKINPGAPIQIVQNGITIRHPALPPVPESPPQPLPPLNLDVLSTAFPPLSTRFFSNPVQQQLLTAARPSSIFPTGPYHNLFKRDKNQSKKRTIKDESVISSLDESEKLIAKRDVEEASKGDSSDDKVRTIM